MSQPIKQICDLYDSGKSMSDISDILFISVSTIFRCLKNHPKRTPTDGLRLYQTNRCIPLTESEQKLIYGSLLGDSSLSKRIDGKNTRFHCSHGLKQKDYIAHKYKILNNSRLNCYTQHSGYNKGSKYWRLGYDNFIYLNEIYAITHRNGMKQISHEWMNHVDMEAISYWFMDDGSSSWRKRNKYIKNSSIAKFSTQSFTMQDHKLLQEKFDSYGIGTTVHKCATGTKLQLSIRANSVQKLFKLMKPYIEKVPSMLYKLKFI